MSSIVPIIKNDAKAYEGDLRHYFKIIFHENKGNANSYHGIRHLLHVLWECHDAIQYYENSIYRNRFQNRALLIAAMFHDAMHCGRIGNDDINIELAIRLLKKHALPQDIEDGTINCACLYIKSTEYDKKHVREANNEYEKVLRDADISQVFSSAWLRIVLFGLSQEIGISPEEMLLSQESFLSSIQFESEWGKFKFDRAIKEKIIEVKELIQILQ